MTLSLSLFQKRTRSSQPASWELDAQLMQNDIISPLPNYQGINIVS